MAFQRSVLFIVFVICFSFNSFGQKLVVASFNIRQQNNSDTGNMWSQRAPYVAALIRFHGFDLFGTQEGFRNQLNDIKTALPRV